MALLKFVLFSGRFLAFLWLKIAKKHGVFEIRAVFWVGFLAFLWLKVAKKHGVSEIRAFLGT